MGAASSLVVQCPRTGTARTAGAPSEKQPLEVALIYYQVREITRGGFTCFSSSVVPAHTGSA